MNCGLWMIVGGRRRLVRRRVAALGPHAHAVLSPPPAAVLPLGVPGQCQSGLPAAHPVMHAPKVPSYIRRLTPVTPARVAIARNQYNRPRSSDAAASE